MDPELKRELDETRALTKENNRMLHAMRRDQWIGLILKVVIWVGLLAIPFYLYQQYLEPIVSRFYVSSTTPSGAFGLPSSGQMQNLINSYKAQ